MAYLKGFQYDGNQATMRLAEGAWTDNDAYKEGGSFAAPLKVGHKVKLVTTVDYCVTLSGAGDTPIGEVMAVSGGKNETNGRWGTIKLYGDFIEECELATASDAIAIGGYVQYSTSGGTYDKGRWTKDGSANDTRVLNSSSASGSIAAGDRIHVLFGAHAF